MNSAFKSGRTTMQAIEIVKNELVGPIGEEFKVNKNSVPFENFIDELLNKEYDRMIEMINRYKK